ncbi:MEIOTIC F-BOX protein MOF-like [Aegilops tauschii subsp. strangulata]|uniref:MEIOTIC F-BOX protein MOF-like n=1 Tax=Aegilops tauschii subsp. strangulata TaxID=200361 RepID=UPI00098A8419|nr:MEIOTIC F-BOX protein MOF-like [Aegilops tauschii subsp. strangulata]
MAASGKRLAGSADRLSDLPDGLLHTVMSFLTARQAVQTCVLSRRWEDLWCSMPCLNIDEREFSTSAILSDSDSDSDDGDEGGPNCTRLEYFVINLLMFHSAATLDVFRFHSVSERKIKFADQWLRRGIKRFPKVVDIDSKNCCCKLPRFGSSSSRLNRLHLSRISLDKTFTQQLRSGCPVLEDLELKWCVLEDAETASCTLKNLTIEHCTIYHPGALTIKVPSLTCLQLVAFSRNWDAAVANEMPFLIKATICTIRLIILPWKLLFSLINVKDLKLTGFRAPANLHDGSDTFPVFHNIRTLLFDTCDLSYKFDMLGCFLNNAPGLEKLTLESCMLPEASKGSKTGGNLKKASLEYDDALTFQCPSLKLTEIKYIYDDDVQKLFDLLLGAWSNLQNTNIVINKKT